MSLVAFSALCLLALLTGAAASAGLHNTNAIKFGPAAASASPDVLPPVEGGEQNLAIDTAQVSCITTNYSSFNPPYSRCVPCDGHMFVLLLPFPLHAAARVRC